MVPNMSDNNDTIDFSSQQTEVVVNVQYMQTLTQYLLCPLTPDEERMVLDVRQQCKAFKAPGDW